MGSTQITWGNRACAGFAHKQMVRSYCSLLQFEVDGVSSGLGYQELFYDLYFLSYSRLNTREGCQIQKKVIFWLFCNICTVLFFIFIYLVTCKIKRSYIWFKRI